MGNIVEYNERYEIVKIENAILKEECKRDEILRLAKRNAFKHHAKMVGIGLALVAPVAVIGVAIAPVIKAGNLRFDLVSTTRNLGNTWEFQFIKSVNEKILGGMLK